MLTKKDEGGREGGRKKIPTEKSTISIIIRGRPEY
jgi:hypothetical protein